MKFLTEFRFEGLSYGSWIRADTWAEAEWKADRRCMGETVIGELVEEIPCD
jgi:hypothetical protein